MSDNAPTTYYEGLYEKCIQCASGDGWYEIKCKLGLWGVSGPTRLTVEDEAMHYWLQYYYDGEYDEHLLTMLVVAHNKLKSNPPL
jgi:hypothetical protein